jgi:hypothetical protein
VQSALTPEPGDSPSIAEDDNALPPCGWFLSSEELRQGLEVQERAETPDVPVDS